MKKNINNLFIKISLLIFVIVATIRSFIDSMFGNKTTLLLYSISIILIVINILKNKKVKNHYGKYPVILFLMLLPSFINNAYLQDNMYSIFFYYFFSITYFILLCFSNVNSKHIEFALKLFIIFSLLTSIITWISFINPNLYVNKIIPLFPKENRNEIFHNFFYLKNRMGLCTHYSRNAFFMVIGIVSYVYFYFKHKNAKQIIGILFILITMLLVGKRGHLLFLIISFILAFFIYNKLSLKSFLKFTFFACLSIFSLYFIIKNIPGTNFAVDRFLNNSNNDVSNGRFEMYNDILTLFENNHFFPLGWGQYAKSTNYVHPGVHNDYLQILCETGLFGICLIIIPNIYILILAVKTCREKKKIIFPILVYNIFFMLYSTTGLPHYDIETYMFYFLINFILFYIINNKDILIKENLI